MLGVGCGCERDGARGDGPDADASEARDACREDGDESEHVPCPLGRDAHGGGGLGLHAVIRRLRCGEGCDFAVGRCFAFRSTIIQFMMIAE